MAADQRDARSYNALARNRVSETETLDDRGAITIRTAGVSPDGPRPASRSPVGPPLRMAVAHRGSADARASGRRAGPGASPPARRARPLRRWSRRSTSYAEPGGRGLGNARGRPWWRLERVGRAVAGLSSVAASRDACIGGPPWAPPVARRLTQASDSPATRSTAFRPRAPLHGLPGWGPW